MTEIASPAGFEELVEYIRQSRAFDFTGYKRASLQRRIDKRLRGIGFNDYEEYRDYLEAHPQEFIELFNTILINVTGFFRDLPMWVHLRDAVLPAMNAVRTFGDKLETVVSDEHWPLPTYREMLFIK